MKVSAITLPFHCGQLVRAKCDPRHVGRVDAVFSGGGQVKIRWLDSGWKSHFPAWDIERVPSEDMP